MAGDEVRMQVSLQNMRDLKPHLPGFSQVNVNIPLWIDHRAGFLPGKNVRTMGNLFDKIMFKQHELDSFQSLID